VAVRHLYVHIPFCRSRCAYCDFASEPVALHLRPGRVDAYLDRLQAELRRAAPLLGDSVDTVYLGGGTPLVLPRTDLLTLVVELAGLRGRPGPAATDAEPGSPAAPARPAPAAAEVPVPAPLEFTVEANPGTVDVALLEALQESGVTRLSLGVQSFSPRLRKSLGRRVSQEDLEACLKAIGDAGWQEWNLDIIHGIPGQTWEEAVVDIDRAVAAGPSHISLYDLTYTDRYRARVAADSGPDAVAAAEEFAEAHYAQASQRLTAAGFERYEVSNFARPGHECRHNLAYWQGADYLGLGAAAVSTVGLERRTNPASVTGYLAGEEPEVELLDERTRLWEKAMLGLRTSAGVVEEEVLSVLDPRAEERLLQQGCLEKRCGKLRLNPGFLDLSNSVVSALLVTPDGA
jgi:oxygen-independent coproporphyrinogen-3 oxidase